MVNRLSLAIKLIYLSYLITVIFEIFARDLFLRNFADAEFHENKTLKKPRSLCCLLKSCPSHEFLKWQMCLLTFCAKIFGFTVSGFILCVLSDGMVK